MVSNSDYSLTLQSTSSIPLAMKIKKYELYFRTPKPQVTLYDQMKAFFYIVHGNEAVMHEFPFMAALMNRNRQFCGGSLIDDNHILTAAHCVAHLSKSDVQHLRVRLGDHNIKTDGEATHVEKRVKRVIRHKGFSSSTLVCIHC